MGGEGFLLDLYIDLLLYTCRSRAVPGLNS